MYWGGCIRVYRCDKCLLFLSHTHTPLSALTTHLQQACFVLRLWRFTYTQLVCEEKSLLKHFKKPSSYKPWHCVEGCVCVCLFSSELCIPSLCFWPPNHFDRGPMSPLRSRLLNNNTVLPFPSFSLLLSVLLHSSLTHGLIVNTGVEEALKEPALLSCLRNHSYMHVSFK